MLKKAPAGWPRSMIIGRENTWFKNWEGGQLFLLARCLLRPKRNVANRLVIQREVLHHGLVGEHGCFVVRHEAKLRGRCGAKEGAQLRGAGRGARKKKRGGGRWWVSDGGRAGVTVVRKARAQRREVHDREGPARGVASKRRPV